MRPAPWIVLLLCCAPGLGLAQQPASPAPASADVAPILSATFARALSSGALQRVLGVRSFRDARGGLVTVRGALDDPQRPGELRLDVEFRAIGAMREETLRLTSAFGLNDGRLRRSGLLLVRGRDRMQASGPLRTLGKTEQLHLSVRETRGERESEREVTVPWGRDAVPFGLAVFVLPLLTDQGLPRTLRFRPYHPVSMALNQDIATLSVAQGELTLTDFVPGQAKPTIARHADGALSEVLLGDNDRLTAIGAREAAALRGD